MPIRIPINLPCDIKLSDYDLRHLLLSNKCPQAMSFFKRTSWLVELKGKWPLCDAYFLWALLLIVVLPMPVWDQGL